MQIIDFIPRGINNAISMDELAVRTRTDKRTVRQLVFKARLAGVPICSSCDEENSGYYLPESKDEAQPYFLQQSARIKSAKKALAAVARYIGGHGNE